MEKKDFVINWNRPAREIYHQVRALAEKPGAVTTFREQPIKIIAVKKTELTSNKPPGTVLDIIKNTGIIVAAKNDSVILEKVQPAGKKIMLAYDFHLGARIQPGELIGNF
jgi:methionyl-tRNA formyltransferase